jgi:uncharacterized membrane protein YdfJ with MMPL/SSD domain
MFRNGVDSAQGQELLEAGFPAGANAPTNVLVSDEADVEAVRSAVVQAPGVAEVSRQKERGPAGVELEATLARVPVARPDST